MTQRLTDAQIANIRQRAESEVGGPYEDDDKIALLAEIEALRETQSKLIELLRKADEYTDRLEWRMFIEKVPEITEAISKKRGAHE